MISLDSAMKLAARAVMCKDWAGRFCVLRRTAFFSNLSKKETLMILVSLQLLPVSSFRSTVRPAGSTIIVYRTYDVYSDRGPRKWITMGLWSVYVVPNCTRTWHRTCFHVAASPSLHAEYWKSGLKTQRRGATLVVSGVVAPKLSGGVVVVRLQLQLQYLR